MTSLTVIPPSQSKFVQSKFEGLFQRSRSRAYNLAYRLTGNPTDAEDVIQDAYLRAWNHFDQYNSTYPFEAWLNRIITNRVIDLRRRDKRAPMVSLDNPVQENDDAPLFAREFAAPNCDPEQIILEPILEERLQQALAALSADYRTAIWLCDVEERSYEEIADIMCCALGTVRSRIHRARVMLRKFMASTNPQSITRRRTLLRQN